MPRPYRYPVNCHLYVFAMYQSEQGLQDVVWSPAAAPAFCRLHCRLRGRGLYSGQTHLLRREEAVPYQVPIVLHCTRLVLVLCSLTTHSMFSWLSSVPVASWRCCQVFRLGADTMRSLILPLWLLVNPRSCVRPHRETSALQPWSRSCGVWAFANQ